MRFYILLLLYLSGAWSSLYGQSKKVSIDIEEVGFSDFINTLSEIYDVEFAYESGLLFDEIFSLQTDTPDLSEVLQILVEDHNLEYLVLYDEKILIREKLSSPTSQQSKRAISIICKDQHTGEFIPSVAIGIKGSSKGVYTDDKGWASLELTEDDSSSTLSIQMLGYKSQEVPIPLNGTEISIGLETLPFSIEEVMVKDRTDLIQLQGEHHSLSLSSESITSLTSGIAGNDIVREIQLLPGVVSFQDQSTGIKIRGGSESSAMMLIDDIPLYHSGHYYGLFSSAHPSYIQSATLYKNNLPISYDGKTDGMLALDGPSFDTLQTVFSAIDLSLVAASGHSTFNLTDQLQLSIAGRTSLGNIAEGGLIGDLTADETQVVSAEDFRLVNRRQLLSSTPAYNFYDINSNLQYVGKKFKMDLSYYRSDDDLEDDFSNSFLSRSAVELVSNTEFYRNNETWFTQGLNLSTSYKIDTKTTILSQIYRTAFDNIGEVDIGLTLESNRGSRTFNTINERFNFVREYGIKTELQKDLSIGKLKLGVDIVNHETSFEIFENQESVRRFETDGIESALYSSLEFDVNEKLFLQVGLRATLYQDEIYPAPRLSLTYKVDSNLKTKMSIGRHNQYVRFLTYENPFGRSINVWYQAGDGNIEVGNTDHLMFGFNYSKNRWSLDVEGYYKKRNNLLEQALFGMRFDEMSILPTSAFTNNEYRLFRGEGQTIGVDVLLSYTQPRYAGWLSYTLSKSTINFEEIFRRSAFPTQDDRRHQVNLVGQYFLGDFTIGATIVYASGRPYTDLDRILNATSRDQLRPEDRISRLPDYIRGDLGISYRVPLASSKFDVGLSVYNILNRQNVNYIQYLFALPSNSPDNPDVREDILLGAESNLLGRTLNLSLKYSF